ncbi:hypothetical protein [Fructobacillus cardui]|uniref:hypothetical protein n=1 Tax=Fructobacillus cardui TaxID=2893170 RepID=UPI00200A8EE6|nr:hypothetical protein [Fructobacillus cardui]MCK8628016.1 hypothetical protein [Fructobacillus cardui]
MSKFTNQDKVNMYFMWGKSHLSPREIHEKDGIDLSTVYYIIRLAETHGVDVLKKSYTKYTNKKVSCC